MLLKLRESITCNGKQHRPPEVIDTVELGISDQESLVLVRRGTAEIHQEASAAAQASEPATEAKPAPAKRTRKTAAAE